MNIAIQAVYSFYQKLGVAEWLLPLLPFLTLLAALYAIIFLAARLLIRFRVVHEKTVFFYLLISPWIIGFLLFTLGPMIYSLYISLTQWNVIDKPKFIGLGNYKAVFQDSLFYKSLSVTFYYSIVSVPLQVVLSIVISLLMNLKIRGSYLFRTIYYLPTLVQGVAQMVLFLWIFNPDVGLFNSILRVFGISGPGWFSSQYWAMPAIIIMSLWTVGGNMLIYLAGLQDIPVSLYEQASLDGANAWQRTWSITLPQLTPVIFFNLVTGIIGAFQTFTQGYMNAGGPNNSLLFYVFYLFENAFSWFKMGYGSALAWVLFVIILFFTALVFKSSPMWVYYEAEQSGKKVRHAKR